MKKLDFSAIITAHTEGTLAHKTLQSVFRALKIVEKHQLAYEIVINIDRGDEATTSYFKEYQNDPRFIILETDFGDLGLSRNHALKRSHGQIVSFLDADDLISDNWYLNSINHVNSSPHPVVVHPKASILFGKDFETTLCLFRNSDNKAAEALIALGANRWISTATAKREIFLQTPYIATKDGFGHEDYTFNIQTLSKGIAHEVANGTTHFYRRRADSLVNTSNQHHATQPYSNLFDIHYLKYLPPITYQRRFTSSRRIPPRYIQEAMNKISSIEPQIKLTTKILEEGLPVFNPETVNSLVRPAFLELISNIEQLPETVILASKASEKDLEKHLSSSGYTVIIITDEPISTSPNYPDTTFLDFCQVAHWLNPTEKDVLLSRLLTQLRPHSLVFLNSKYGKTWQNNHKDLRIVK